MTFKVILQLFYSWRSKYLVFFNRMISCKVYSWFGICRYRRISPSTCSLNTRGWNTNPTIFRIVRSELYRTISDFKWWCVQGIVIILNTKGHFGDSFIRWINNCIWNLQFGSIWCCWDNCPSITDFLNTVVRSIDTNITSLNIMRNIHSNRTSWLINRINSRLTWSNVCSSLFWFYTVFHLNSFYFISVEYTIVNSTEVLRQVFSSS